MTTVPRTLLYVEDNPDDVFLFQRALRGAGVECHVQTVSNAPAARSYLGGKVPYSDRSRFPMPSLIVTDTVLRGDYESVIDLVSWIRAQPGLAPLPVICLTGQIDSDIVAEFSRLNITRHQKTGDMAEATHAVKTALGQLQ
jgi:CheY-like chemotaxis protein